jgi:beta-ketodecanoyl-[acyl-carrier-protein] synthase
MSQNAQGAIPVISSTGLFTPTDTISNEELGGVHREGERHPRALCAGQGADPDPAVMAPRWDERPNEAISVLAEIGVAAAKDALARAGRDARDVDAVICAVRTCNAPIRRLPSKFRTRWASTALALT